MDIEDELDIDNRDDLEQSDEEQNEDFIENLDAEPGPVEGTADGEQPEENPEEGENQTAQKKNVKKRVVLNPRPKLDSQRLGGPKGIPILPKLFENKKFKGKGFEREDLDQVMSMLEHWGHRLFPIMTFDTLLATIEKLGAKKPIQVCIKKMRMDMPLLDEDFVTQRDIDEGESSALNAQNDDPFPTEDTDMNDAFDELLRSQNRTNSFNGTDGAEVDFPATVNITPERTVTITDEMRERIERNKQLALERKRQRQLERERMNTSVEGETAGDLGGATAKNDTMDTTRVVLTNLSMNESAEVNKPSAEDSRTSPEPEMNETNNCETTELNAFSEQTASNHEKENHPVELLNEDEMLEEMWGQ